MRDDYIDLAEVNRNIGHFINAVKNFVSLHLIIGELQAEQQAFYDRFNEALTRAEDSRSTVSLTGRSEREVSTAVRDRLRVLYDQLVGLQHSYSLDLNRFFLNGSRSDVGKSVAHRQRTLARCIDALKQYPDLPNAATWRAELEALQAEFGGVTGKRSEQESGKRSRTQTLRQIRKDWASKYASTKFIMRGVLKRNGLEAQWKSLFRDLQVSASPPPPAG